ncbi:MAG: MFS transporter [Oscillospiraceae bacterium]|nr:MFS transporter [Oscillospiraceae bacterium]
MKRVHYAWMVCLGCGILLFCTSGLSINAFTIYQPYILLQNGFTNAQSSYIITVRSLFGFLSMFLTGVYYRVFSLRRGMTLAGVCTAVGFLLFGLAKSFAAYCAAAAFIGMGYGLGAMIPITIILEHWFVSKRTFAIGLCSAVTGLSTLGIPSLLTWMIERFSLSVTFIAESVFIAGMICAAGLLLRDRPEERGVEPYGIHAEETGGRKNQPVGTLGVRHWVLLIPMLCLIGAMNNIGYSHLTVLATSQGFSSHVTALAITASGVMLTLSKCIFGWTSERIGTDRTNWIYGVIVTVGLLLCCMMGTSVPRLFAAFCTYGFGLALTAVGLSAWPGDLSNHAQYDRNVRRFQVYYGAGTLMFSSLPGILADRFGGSYVPAYLFFVACTVYIVFAIGWVYRHALPMNESESV